MKLQSSLDMVVALNIHKYRKELKMSIRELAEKSGLSKYTISRIESNRNSYNYKYRAHIDTIGSIAYALGVEPKALLDDSILSK
jgi:transcriptional regulator with XRE-family HTH domain